MKQLKINKNYLLLKNWWETIDLSNYEKSFFNKEIISFNQQLLRLKEKKIRIGTYGKSGVGKSSVLNSLLKKDIFKTDIINGTTKEIQSEICNLKDQTLNSLELLDSPGFDFCNIKSPDKVYSYINHSDLILFIVSGDLNRNELNEINSFIKDGKKIILILNKIDLFNKNELKEIIENIKFKLPKDLNIPVEIVHLTGSVELGPITGMAEAIVDLVATGKTLKENGLIKIDDLYYSTARLIGNPLSMRLDDNHLRDTILSIESTNALSPSFILPERTSSAKLSSNKRITALLKGLAP